MSSAQKSSCPHGHPYTEDNSYLDPAGYRRCRECRKEQGRRYCARNPEKRRVSLQHWYWGNDGRRKQRNTYLQRTHGVTEETYLRMLQDQEGVCAICGEAPVEGHNLVVDHSHLTGLIRGLLCPTCNQGIGLLGDDYEGTKRANSYTAKERWGELLGVDT